MNALGKINCTNIVELKNLSKNEQRFIIAMRNWRLSKIGRPYVHHHLFNIFGIFHVESAINSFEKLMSLLADQENGSIRLLRTGNRFVGEDEQTVLHLISSYQANDFKNAVALADKLVGLNRAEDILIPVSVLSEALDSRSTVFTKRESQPLAQMSVIGTF